MASANELHQKYPPINSYGIIGDCHSVVLVSPEGSVDWGCLPDFDSPAIFCRLLDAERGGPRHFVYSKAMCWVALDRGSEQHGSGQLSASLYAHCPDQ